MWTQFPRACENVMRGDGELDKDISAQALPSVVAHKAAPQDYEEGNQFKQHDVISHGAPRA